MPNISQICGHNVPKVCLEGRVDIMELSPLPIQLSHMFVTLALVKRGRVGVPNGRISYFWTNFTLPKWSKQLANMSPNVRMCLWNLWIV